MNILLLSTGGGGGNILRSLKALFRRDLSLTQKTDARYAERLRRCVATRFLDTNEFSLSDVPKEERLLIGPATTRRLGSMHNPEVAREALEESKAEVETLLNRYSVVVLMGTGGKGTGAGTIFPLAQMARQQKKLVIPIFVRPSFERHEVQKRRYDHALEVTEQFDSARIRLIEILNDRGYSDTDPQLQSEVWERMNRPIAGGLRGLLYVLWDLSQVDPSDLCALFGGHGRLRIGFSAFDPPVGQEPDDEQVQKVVRDCWDNPYYEFAGPVGTSLICIQGDWSNVVDGKIKGRLAACALSSAGDPPYNPLYARAFHVPKPWGITALFAEYTGNHSPLEIDWTCERKAAPLVNASSNLSEAAITVAARSDEGVASNDLARPWLLNPVQLEPPGDEHARVEKSRSFCSLWEFAVALDRSDPAAIALAGNSAECEMPLERTEIRKLLGTLWFRSVFPRLSEQWRDRILEAVLASVVVPNHTLRNGRRTVHLSELSFDQLKQIVRETIVSDAIRRDLHLLLTVGTLWGTNAMARVEFGEAPDTVQSSKLALLLQPFRHT